MFGVGLVPRIVALSVAVFSVSGLAQEIPALSVSPGMATMLIGEARTFRAVGKDGRIRHDVHWSISTERAVTLTTDGDEATVQAVEASSAVVLTATANAESAAASIEIRSGHTVPAGTVMWSVQKIPGCKEKNMTQAVPTANGPDLYVEEECPRGTFIRALTADGREMWRRQITGVGADLSPATATKSATESAEHLDLSRSSVCDEISPGMSKDEVLKVANGHNLHLEPKQSQRDAWELEEQGFRCTISFDGKSGTVVKKRKTIVTD